MLAAVGRFRRIAGFLDEQLTSRAFVVPGPTQNLIGRLAIAAVRQAEAMAALFRAGPFYATQIGQLLRGLLEMWRVAAWLTAPDVSLARNQRAIGLWKKALREERATMALQQALAGMEPPLEKLAELDRQEELVASAEQELLEGARPREPGSGRDDYRDLGHPERYIVFRRESEVAHVGAIALGQMVQQQDDLQVCLGGQSPVADRARKLVIAWDAMADIAEIVVKELSLDSLAWQALRERTYAEFSLILGPLVVPG
ncbi:MAG: hypothetical protein ABIJ48_04000 [Actinomycetota bacterium]